ncbi:protein artichoke [Chelonus insularis]|uniref:protein artichoke n=1 Tax=Chelonus insularis TaxID=460826 RepID=UPI00158B356C|nr:protein artichoke [Chelonus insularis]XP_034938507.1 protein artichoke [Chelonus insularis]
MAMKMSKPPEGGGGLYLIILLIFILKFTYAQEEYGCPPQDKILPCRCSMRDMEYQVWCSHSELPKVLEGLKAVSHYISHPVDELILENNNLPSLPGKVFTSLRVLRLMLRNNHLERVSSGWLEGLHDSLLELFIVEPDLRSLPVDSLDNLQGLEAITLQSRSMKRLPKFSGLTKLRYLQVNSLTLLELSPMHFRDLPHLEQLHIFGSPKLMRLEAGLFRGLPKLSLVNITNCGITWIHPRAFVDLPELREVSLENNKIPDAAIVGRAMMDLPVLSTITLIENRIPRLQGEAFVNLPSLSRLYLTKNLITEIFPGAFQLLPMLRVLDLNYNLISRIHPEFFVQRSGSSLEELWIIGNNLRRINEVRAIMDALPRLKFLDVSYNYLEEIPYGSLRGHLTLERLHLDHNHLSYIQRETFSGMPALRELRLKNNSLTNSMEAPFWNLPGLKGLDLSENYFRHIEPILLSNLPNLRKLDLSGNGITVVEPEAFINVPALEHLNISGNAISIIHPMTMRHLTELYELDVSWNRLLEVVPSLPKNVEHLYMQMNRIVELPALETRDLALPILRTFDINANGIERIPPGALSEMPNLRKLNLGYNALRIIEDGTFDGLVRLEQLDLRYNRIMSVHGRSLMPLKSLKDLNLRGNRLEVLRPDIFVDNIELQRLDLARNNIAQFPHSTFTSTRNLRELYASHNTLSELPASLHGLSSLEVLDLSFNKLVMLSSDTLSTLTSLLELKLGKNKIMELREGALNRLPRLTVIDLENNDLRVIERNAIKNLPELQAIRLGKNRIQMIPTGAFTDLPLLQIAELQENRIQEIAQNAFINVPNILLLNLSYNLLPSLEHAGISNLRSLEVLDLSFNRLTMVSNNNLADLEWLVELKMDNNRICGIQGSPFDNMPRLRVLSMRTNRMSSINENAFKRLRSNIAVLDIDGNPLSCSCGMIWLRGWIQQSSSEGPKCADGTLFREMRLSRTDCLNKKEREPVHPDCETEMIDQTLMSSQQGDKRPPPAWMNTHSPTKFNQEPDYYEDYLDVPYNMTNKLSPSNINQSSIISQIPTGPIKFIQTTTSAPPIILQKKKTPLQSPGSSGFTFFGVPLPSLNFNLWGNSRKKSHRKEETAARSKYKPFIPREPEMYRGFTPLPETEGGFKPIVDPRIMFQRQMTNETIRNGTRNGIVTRVYQDNKKTINEEIENKEKKRIFTNEGSNIKPDTSTFSIGTDIHQTPSLEVVNKIHSNSYNVSSVNKTESTINGSTTQGYNNVNFDVDSEESVLLEGKVASRIVWTTPGTNLQKEYVPEVHSTEGASLTQDKVFWNTEENRPSLSKPIDTTPMTSETTFDPIIFVTTTENRTSDYYGATTTLQSLLQNRIASQTSQALEPSALSALLIPGGQVTAFNPVMAARPAGKSTIEKVPSPFLVSKNDSHITKIEQVIKNESKYSPEIITEKMLTKNNFQGLHEDDPFNWYFQNYNITNLEPYVAVIESGVAKICTPHILVILVMQISFILVH